MNDTEILQRDITILEAMVGHLDDYLASDATHWDMVITMGLRDLPPMSLGGILMRRQRLMVTRNLLDDQAWARLSAAVDRFDATILENVVRFEQRAGMELQARMREWTHYLNDLNSRTAADPEYYRTHVDTRVVIGELAKKLSERPFVLADHVPGDIVALDRHLSLIWLSGHFIWPDVWKPAYPGEEYWYLYGHPIAGK